eukprot:390799-Prorocentrum_minimum.AAC.1
MLLQCQPSLPSHRLYGRELKRARTRNTPVDPLLVKGTKTCSRMKHPSGPSAGRGGRNANASARGALAQHARDCGRCLQPHWAWAPGLCVPVGERRSLALQELVSRQRVANQVVRSTRERGQLRMLVRHARLGRNSLREETGLTLLHVHACTSMCTFWLLVGGCGHGGFRWDIPELPELNYADAGVRAHILEVRPL